MMTTEKTNGFTSGPQVLISTGSLYPEIAPDKDSKRRRAQLAYTPLTSDREFRDIIRDPTIKLATKIATALLLLQPWIVECDDDKYAEFLWKQIEPWRTMIIRSAMRGMLINGFRMFEVVYDDTNNAPAIGGKAKITGGIKALRGTFTTPIIWQDTGEFAGCEVRDVQGGLVGIDEEHCIFVNADEDYLGDLGEPSLRDVQETYRKYERCDKGAQRYDEKVAGGFLAVGYPDGESTVLENGEKIKKANVEIARQFAESIKASGYGLYPIKPNPETGEFDRESWKFDHVMANGAGMQPNFIAREKYLDALKLRVFGIPERATTEGQFGTKAEAESHADIALICNAERGEFILHGVNRGPVAALNRANNREPKEAQLKTGNISEEDKKLFSEIYKQLLQDPNNLNKVDVDQLQDKLQVPLKSEEQQAADLKKREEDAKKAQDEQMAQQEQLAAVTGKPPKSAPPE